MKVFNSLFGDKSSNEEKLNKCTDAEYKKMALEFLEYALNINNSTDNWKLEKRTANGDTVESKHVTGVGKVFRLTGEVNFPPKKLISELFFNIESVPKWNPTILSSKRIKMIGDNVDINYHISAPAVGGLVKTRDFVTARFYTSREGCFIIGGGSIQHPDIPEHHDHIRGEAGAGCQITKPIPGTPDRCTFQWLLSARLNGWLPQYLVDMGCTDSLFDYINNIRRYGNKLKEQGLMDDGQN